jgi:hypothetical protein
MIGNRLVVSVSKDRKVISMRRDWAFYMNLLDLSLVSPSFGK